MEYSKFRSIFNEIIFEKSKADLIRNVANSPERYIGLFRPTKPKAKLLQNLLQSHEIRFGEAFEKLLAEYLIENEFQILEKNFKSENNESVKVDQFFSKDSIFYFVEQKIRDDHDSTKKRGQIANFEKKLATLINLYDYDNKNLKGFFYFIDPHFTKNKNYYENELKQMENDYGVELYICYGKEFFNLINLKNIWDEIIEHLQKWRAELPDTPEINFDVRPEQSFEEIKELPPYIFRKLFGNKELVKEIVLTLFPKRIVLKKLADYFSNKTEKQIYKTLKTLLDNILTI